MSRSRTDLLWDVAMGALIVVGALAFIDSLAALWGVR